MERTAGEAHLEDNRCVLQDRESAIHYIVEKDILALTICC